MRSGRAIRRKSRLPNTDGSTASGPPHFCMATTVARHVGDIVAVVVATSLAAARDAAEQVAVEYRPLPAVTHAPLAVSPGAALAWHEGTSNVCIDSLLGDDAATDAAFARPHMSCDLTPGCSASPACRWNRAQRSASMTRQPANTRCTPAPAGQSGRATIWRRCWASPSPTSAWSCTTSAAISAPAARSIRNSPSSSGRPAGLAGR